jgi:acyl-CoA thioester hydrolase
MSDPSPVFSSWFEIEPAWIDHNDHLNMGYYPVIFDRASDEVFKTFGFGPDYVAATNHTTFSLEFHVRYLKEVKLGEKVRSSFFVIDHDTKRFHTFQELHNESGTLCATGEGLTIHVTLEGPKVTPMPGDILGRVAAMATDHAQLPRPDGVGSRIGIRRK